jgi:hypothetical protein
MAYHAISSDGLMRSGMLNTTKFLNDFAAFDAGKAGSKAKSGAGAGAAYALGAQCSSLAPTMTPGKSTGKMTTPANAVLYTSAMPNQALVADVAAVSGADGGRSTRFTLRIVPAAQANKPVGERTCHAAQTLATAARHYHHAPACSRVSIAQNLVLPSASEAAMRNAGCVMDIKLGPGVFLAATTGWSLATATGASVKKSVVARRDEEFGNTREERKEERKQTAREARRQGKEARQQSRATDVPLFMG